MNNNRNRVCPVELASSLDNKFRRWLQNPRTILELFVHEGMTVLDIGCGPGFFSVEMAILAGETGHVLSADLQEGMLAKLRQKIKGTNLEPRVTTILCQPDNINVSEKVDFILAFYMVHEVPDKAAFFNQLRVIMNKNGKFLIVEPKLFHVSRKDFESTLAIAKNAGFTINQGPKLLLSWSAVLSYEPLDTFR